jgi:hypothetical protein
MDSICSAGVIGTAGLSRFRGTEPVMATAMTTGFMDGRSFSGGAESWQRRKAYGVA